jgi:bacterioferritin-associated ferredoxin
MIVCLCNNVSDREIRQALDLGLSTMAELRRDLRVAADCGACVDCAKRVLSAHQGSKAIRESVPSKPFVAVDYTVQDN